MRYIKKFNESSDTIVSKEDIQDIFIEMTDSFDCKDNGGEYVFRPYTFSDPRSDVKIKYLVNVPSDKFDEFNRILSQIEHRFTSLLGVEFKRTLIKFPSQETVNRYADTRIIEYGYSLNYILFNVKLVD